MIAHLPIYQNQAFFKIIEFHMFKFFVLTNFFVFSKSSYLHDVTLQVVRPCVCGLDTECLEQASKLTLVMVLSLKWYFSDITRMSENSPTSVFYVHMCERH